MVTMVTNIFEFIFSWLGSLAPPFGNEHNCVTVRLTILKSLLKIKKNGLQIFWKICGEVTVTVVNWG